MRVTSERRNSILSSLSSAEFNAISADLETVALRKNVTLFEAHERIEHVYFPLDCVISFSGDTGEGRNIEVWSVGNEGMAGISGVLAEPKPFRGIVQVPGSAFRGEASSLRHHFHKCGRFHDGMIAYLHRLIGQIAYLAICNNSHPIEQRFSRWLLMIQDRAGTSKLNFTQDFIANVLGTRRATISVAAARLQADGLIRYTPGSIKITSRKGLREATCHCYAAIRAALQKGSRRFFLR